MPPSREIVVNSALFPVFPIWDFGQGQGNIATRKACGNAKVSESRDFGVFTEKKRVETLRYRHRNPVTRDWFWNRSSETGAAIALCGKGARYRAGE